MTITKDMTIGSVLNLDTGCAPIFLNMGMHCLGCPSASGESIEMAAMVHGMNPDEIVAQLNEYFAKAE